MTEGEVDGLIDFLSKNPTAGDEMSGTGGCRKVRWGAKGGGKSGGVRTITFYSGLDFPVFLLTVFGKGEKANLTKGERNRLATMTKVLVDEYSKKVVNVGAQS